MTNLTQDLLRPRDIAQDMHLSSQRVRQLIANGTLPHIRIGRRIYIPAAAWSEWLAQQRDRALAAVVSEDKARPIAE